MKGKGNTKSGIFSPDILKIVKKFYSINFRKGKKL
jgi:hypothetical protein